MLVLLDHSLVARRWPHATSIVEIHCSFLKLCTWKAPQCLQCANIRCDEYEWKGPTVYIVELNYCLPILSVPSLSTLKYETSYNNFIFQKLACRVINCAKLNWMIRDSYKNYVLAELYYLNFSQLFSLLVQKVMRSLRLDMREYDLMDKNWALDIGSDKIRLFFMFICHKKWYRFLLCVRKFSLGGKSHGLWCQVVRWPFVKT